jgi:hypothetical protein
MQPSVVAAAVNFEKTAHAGESKFGSVSLDKRVLHPDCLVKYSAAFFRMSRFSVVRRSSALSLAISACIALRSLDSGSSAFLNLLTHVYKTPSAIPSRLATSATVSPLSITCLTASSLNSAVYFVLLISSALIQF